MSIFYSNFAALCARNNKSLSAVAQELGLSRTSPNGWKKGKRPRDVTLQKVAAYFDVPVESLVEKQIQLNDEPGRENEIPVHPKADGKEYTDAEILAAIRIADEGIKEAIRILLGLK